MTNRTKDPALVSQIFWSIRSVHTHLSEIQEAWAKKLNISSPQLGLLFALADFDQERQGIPVSGVGKILQVDSTFIATQSKLLEGKGFLSRKSSDQDARIVKLSLTDKAIKQLSSLSAGQGAVNAFLFSDFSDQDLRGFAKRMAILRSEFEKASRLAALDLDLFPSSRAD